MDTIGQAFWSQKRRTVLSCPKSLSDLLAGELRALGFEVLSQSETLVETTASLDDAMRLNLHIRTAQRVLCHVADFTASTPEEMYNAVNGVAWEEYIAEDGYLSVTSYADTESIKDGRFANLKCKDAVVDRIKEKRNVRPDSGPDRSKAVVHLYWKDDKGSVYIDTSGEPLHKRGYRKTPVRAPMQETLASAIVLATGWRGEGDFVNPMCGSGTLAIEATMIALNRAPGVMRENFGFMHIKGFNKNVWETMKKEARSAEKRELACEIVATDISREAVSAGRQNAKTAGVDRFIKFSECDFEETPLPTAKGVVVLNPEYGERVGDATALEETYKRIGDFFKKKCTGYRGFVFTGNPSLAKKIGLKTKRKMPFWNGDIECRLLEFELYSGSKRVERE